MKVKPKRRNSNFSNGIEMKTISVHELAKQNEKSDIELIDVRTPMEYREVHAKQAVTIGQETFASSTTH